MEPLAITGPWSSIAEDEETGALSYEMHIPTPDGDAMIVWDEEAVRELHTQLTEFLELVEQKHVVEEIMAADSGGH